MQIFKWVPAKVEEHAPQAQDVEQNCLNTDNNNINNDSTTQSSQEILLETVLIQNGADQDSKLPTATNGSSQSDAKSLPLPCPSSINNDVGNKNVPTTTVETNGMNKENVGSDLDSCSNSTSSLNSDNETQAAAAAAVAVTEIRDGPSKIVTMDKDEIVKSIAEKQEESVFKEIAKINQEKEEAEAAEKAKKAASEEADLARKKKEEEEEKGKEEEREKEKGVEEEEVTRSADESRNSLIT